MWENKDLLTIGKAAEFLNVSIDTLRRWDKSGKLKAIRSAGKHRYYSMEQLDRFVESLFSIAGVWAESQQAPNLTPDYHCETRDVFKARLDKMAVLLDGEINTKDLAPLITAVTGEIGNNSFDHNFGNWPDVPGIFFGYDTNKRIIVLADRGVGIRTTLSRVRPDINSDTMAIRIAFTETISGRAPEQRGNGLKFVRDVAIGNPLGIYLHSGTVFADISKDNGSLAINSANKNIRGVLAKIIY